MPRDSAGHTCKIESPQFSEELLTFLEIYPLVRLCTKEPPSLFILLEENRKEIINVKCKV